MIRNLANILDQHSELIEEEMFKLFFSQYHASDHFKLFRKHFNTLSEPEEIQTFVKQMTALFVKKKEFLMTKSLNYMKICSIWTFWLNAFQTYTIIYYDC